jgi:cation:H+ antiporter
VVVASVLALVGLGLLTFSAEHLVLGASRIAVRLRVSTVVVGVVVIGLGTSAPEFLVSGVAAARGDTGLAIGNIVGSNILNVTLILGVAALIRMVGATSSVIRREVRLAAAAVGLFALVAWLGLTVWSAIGLSLATVVAFGLLLQWARHGRNTDVADDATEFAEHAAPVDVPVPPSRLPAWFEPIRAGVGLAGVLIGAQLLVTNASSIAERLGVSQVVIGVTLVAFGTSVPELVTTIVAQRRGESDLVIGNLFGSNLFNSLAGGATIGFASGATAGHHPPVALLVTMALTTVLAWALLRRGLRLNRWEGAILLLIYLATMPIVLSG